MGLGNILGGILGAIFGGIMETGSQGVEYVKEYRNMSSEMLREELRDLNRTHCNDSNLRIAAVKTVLKERGEL